MARNLASCAVDANGNKLVAVGSAKGRDGILYSGKKSDLDLAKELAAQIAVAIPTKTICTTERLYDYWALAASVKTVNLDLHDAKGIAAARASVAAQQSRLALCPSTHDAALKKTLAGLGLTAVVFDPCFTVRAGQDFVEVMAANRTSLQKALQASGK